MTRSREMKGCGRGVIMVWERVRAGNIVIAVIEMAALGTSTTAFCLPPESGGLVIDVRG